MALRCRERGPSRAIERRFTHASFVEGRLDGANSAPAGQLHSVNGSLLRFADRDGEARRVQMHQDLAALAAQRANAIDRGGRIGFDAREARRRGFMRRIVRAVLKKLLDDSNAMMRRAVVLMNLRMRDDRHALDAAMRDLAGRRIGPGVRPRR